MGFRTRDFLRSANQLHAFAVGYKNLKLSTCEAVGWANHGFTPAEAVPWIAKGYSPDQAAFHADAFRSPEQAMACDPPKETR